MLQNEITEQDVENALTNINSNIVINNKKERDLELLEQLTHRARGRKFWRVFGYDELKQAKEIIDFVVEEKECSYMEEKENEKKKTEIRDKLEIMAMSEGFTLLELLEERQTTGPIVKKKRGKYGTKPMQYMVEEFGTSFYWTGIGLTPVVFQYAYKKYGTKKRDYKLSEPVEGTRELRSRKLSTEQIEECKRFLGNE